MQRQWEWIVLYSSTNSLLDDPLLKKTTLNLQTCKPGATAFVTFAFFLGAAFSAWTLNIRPPNAKVSH